MEQGIVNQIDGVWLGFPDIVFFNGKFIIVYRKTTHHKSNTSGIWMSISDDLKHFEHFEIIKPKPLHRWNCPRLSICDDQLVMIVDCVEAKDGQDFGEAEKDNDNLNIYILRSKDGIYWDYPILTNMKGIVPDKVSLTNKQNDFKFLTTCHKKPSYETVEDVWIQESWFSNDCVNWDLKKTISLPILLDDGSSGMNCEGSICYDGSKYICLMRNNSQGGFPATVSFSNGLYWEPPKLTRLFGCHRPTFGILKSGNYLVTYREQTSRFSKDFWARNTFACLAPKRSVYSDTPFDEINILSLDHDRSIKPDGGYTGWIQINNGDIIVVNYITDNFDKPYIKWYKIDEDDFCVLL